MPLRTASLILALGASVGAACQQAAPPATSQSAQAAPAAPVAIAEPEAPEPAPEATPLPKVAERFLAPWPGDLDGMVERRYIRVLTVQNPATSTSTTWPTR